MKGLFIRAVAAAFALAATTVLAEADLRPWKGQGTPALAGTDVHGKPYDLGARRGRVIVVNFWATWCEPCRDELPSLERMQKARGGESFEVVSVNFSESPEKIRTFLEREFVELPVILDRDKATAGRWKVGGLPMTFIIDSRGRVRYQVYGERKWDDAQNLAVVDKLIAETPRASRR